MPAEHGIALSILTKVENLLLRKGHAQRINCLRTVLGAAFVLALSGAQIGLCSEVGVSLAELDRQAKSYAQHKQWNKAQQSYKEILRRQQREFGAEDFRLAKPLSDVVRVTCIDGKCAATVPYLKQLLQVRQKHFGPVHPQVATTLLLLGEAYEKMKDYDNALVFFRQAAQMQETLTGKDSPISIGTRRNTIRVLKEKG
jgi:tetratricopeptide (TPR) repeat protein